MEKALLNHILSEYEKRITRVTVAHSNTFVQAIFELSIYQGTIEYILYSKTRFVWFIILWLWRPANAHSYFAKLYADIRIAKVLLNKKREDELCSSSKKEETHTDASQKATHMQSKKILDASGKPLQSK